MGLKMSAGNLPVDRKPDNGVGLWQGQAVRAFNHGQPLGRPDGHWQALAFKANSELNPATMLLKEYAVVN